MEKNVIVFCKMILFHASDSYSARGPTAGLTTVEMFKFCVFFVYIWIINKKILCYSPVQNLSDLFVCTTVLFKSL